MELSFVKVLNTGISAGWLILVVLAVRLVLKNAPKAMHCLLWAMVAVRLMCPVSIESEFSLIPSRETVPERYMTMEGEVRQSEAVLSVVDNALYPQPVQIPVGAAVDQVQTREIFWTLIWLAGMGLMGLYALISYFRIRKRVLARVHLRENIWICDYIDTPFILGLVRPKIYLPSGLEAEEQMHVLAHEMAHLRRKDHWWKPLGFFLLSVYWFHPLIWIAYICLCRDIEMACDEKVVRDLGPEGKRAYSTALLNCSVRGSLVAACPLAFGEVGVKERVKSVLRYKKPAFWVTVISAVFCVAVAVCFLTDPVQKEEGKRLTLEKVLELAEKETELDWEDFDGYAYTDVGSGLYIHRYEIDDCFALYVGGPSRESKPDYVNLTAGEDRTDIRSGDLEDFILEHTHGPEATQIQTEPFGNGAFFGAANCNMWLNIPQGWHYEYLDQYDGGGIAFRPDGEKEGWAVLRFYPQGFGVCGTGLEQKQMDLGQYRVSLGYYDGSADWSFLIFEGLPGSYVASPENAQSWWPQYEEQIMQILSTAQLAQGMKNQAEIQEIAAAELADAARQAVEDAETKVLPVMGEPGYMAHFHGDTGLWEVGLYFLIDSSPRAVVWLDAQGNVVEHENWNLNLYAEDVTPKGLTLVCEQYGLIPGDRLIPMDLMTGAPYWLEVWNGSQWEMIPYIPEETVWTAEGWLINRNDTTRWDVNWGYLYGELGSGTYRIGKNVSKGNHPGQYTHQNYYAVFQIPENEKE